MPRVSVIIPTYNSASNLEQAIESALHQTFRDLEIIVVDDGSTDNTASAIQRFGSSVRYIRQANGGVSAARNRGIEASTGEILALLDADDWWEPNKLAEQIPLLDSDPQIGLVYTDLRVLYENGDVVPSFLASRPLAGDGYVFDRLLSSAFILPSTVLLRRACLDELGMFHESMRSHEDIELWLRLSRFWKFALIPQPLTHRRQGSSNLTANPFLRAEYGVRLCEKLLEYPDLTKDHRGEVTRKLANSLFDRAYFYFTEGEHAKARVDLVRSFKLGKRTSKIYLYWFATLLPARAMALLRRIKSPIKPKFLASHAE